MTTHALRTFVYAYPLQPSASTIRNGSATMLTAGTRVSIMRTVGPYAVVRIGHLVAPVLRSELEAVESC